MPNTNTTSVTTGDTEAQTTEADTTIPAHDRLVPKGA